MHRLLLSQDIDPGISGNLRDRPGGVLELNLSGIGGTVLEGHWE